MLPSLLRSLHRPKRRPHLRGSRREGQCLRLCPSAHSLPPPVVLACAPALALPPCSAPPAGEGPRAPPRLSATLQPGLGAARDLQGEINV